MSKMLILVRHAKTEDARPDQRDFDRKLTGRGVADARRMSLLLRRKEITPAYILCSPALRTQQTAMLFAAQTGADTERVLFDPALYNAPAAILAEAIQQNIFPEAAGTLLLVAHNPGISQLAMQCAPDLPLDYLPTCGMVLLKTNIKSWTDFVPQSCRLSSFELP